MLFFFCGTTDLWLSWCHIGASNFPCVIALANIKPSCSQYYVKMQGTITGRLCFCWWRIEVGNGHMLHISGLDVTANILKNTSSCECLNLTYTPRLWKESLILIWVFFPPTLKWLSLSMPPSLRQLHRPGFWWRLIQCCRQRLKLVGVALYNSSCTSNTPPFLENKPPGLKGWNRENWL